MSNMKVTDLQKCMKVLLNERNEIAAQAVEVPLIVMSPASVRSTAFTVRSFNQYERMSIDALISWAAANNNMPEANVAACCAAMFDADDMEKIDRSHYETVVSCLLAFKATVN